VLHRKELKICKRRGHYGPDFSDGCVQCKWCGIWRRRVIEEREDEPPEKELNIGVRTDREIERLNRDLQAATVPTPKTPRRMRRPGHSIKYAVAEHC
jgi:hypothetical protein